ncbi:hypothetical protein MRB53_039374 [Persea americana]|nr:hypothetical protein MRB53_039374 [Persea americana]
MSTVTEYGTLTYAALGVVAVTAVLFLLSQPTGLGKWLKEKNYQYELTSGLYMLTPTEKFVFSESKNGQWIHRESVLMLSRRLNPLHAWINDIGRLLPLSAITRYDHHRKSFLLLGRRYFDLAACKSSCTRGIKQGWESYSNGNA